MVMVNQSQPQPAVSSLRATTPATTMTEINIRQNIQTHQSPNKIPPQKVKTKMKASADTARAEREFKVELELLDVPKSKKESTNTGNSSKKMKEKDENNVPSFPPHHSSKMGKIIVFLAIVDIVSGL